MGLSGSVVGKKKENHEYLSESQVNCDKLTEKQIFNCPEGEAGKMDINEICDMPADPADSASESTLESEIDALSKIIDTKDDNDTVFKLNSNAIAFPDSLQDHSTKSNKCELLPDDGLAISDILDGSKELESFISPSNVNSDLQEVLGGKKTLHVTFLIAVILIV